MAKYKINLTVLILSVYFYCKEGVALLLVPFPYLTALCVFQRCYWSDMFTGRLRSEIPTALVRHADCV